MSELEEQLSSGRIDSVITEQQSNQMLIELQDLTNQVKNLKKDKTNLGEDNCNLRKQIEQLEVTISKNEHDLARYEKLIQTLERSKEDLIEKLQNTSKEKNYEERDRQQLITDIGNLKKILVQKEGEIEEMRNSVIELDQRNDMLQNQLDYKTEELYQTQEVLQHQNAENTASKQRILFISSKEESYEKRLQEREKEIVELKRQYQILIKELHDMKEIDNIRAHDTNQLSSDVETLTRENQLVKEQLIKISEEKEYFKIENENIKGRTKQLEQNVRAIEIEKGDIQVTLKEVCSENQRLQESINNMNYEQKDMNNQAKALERELHAAHMAIQQLEENKEQMLYDIQQYDENLTAVTQQYEAVVHQLNEAREDRDSLLHDHETQRNISFNLESSKEELHRQIMLLDNERNIIMHHNDELKSELDNLRQRADYERSRYHQLEMILNKERVKLQKYEESMGYNQNYNDDNDSVYSMASSNKSYDKRNKANLQKVISQLESEIEEKEYQNRR